LEPPPLDWGVHLNIIAGPTAKQLAMDSLFAQDYGMFQVYHQCVHFNDPIAHGHVHWDDMIISPCIKVMLVLDDTSVSAEELVASMRALIKMMKKQQKTARDLILMHVPPSSGGQWSRTAMDEAMAGTEDLKDALKDATVMAWHRPLCQASPKKDPFPRPYYHQKENMTLLTGVLLRGIAELLVRDEEVEPRTNGEFSELDEYPPGAQESGKGANEQSSSSEPPKTSLVMGLGDAIDSSSSGSDQDEDDEGGFEVERASSAAMQVFHHHTEMQNRTKSLLGQFKGSKVADGSDAYGDS